MDEQARRLVRPDRFPARVIPERAEIPVRVQATVRPAPARTPAEPGDPESLEPLDKRPQLVDPKRLLGPRHEVLAHGRRSYGPGRRSQPFVISRSQSGK